MVSAEFECGPVGVSMMQTSAAPGGPEMSPASAEASYLRGMAASVAASGASPYPHPEAILPHSHHPHMQVTQSPLLKTHGLLNPEKRDSSSIEMKSRLYVCLGYHQRVVSSVCT